MCFGLLKRLKLFGFGRSGRAQVLDLALLIIFHYLKSNLDGFKSQLYRDALISAGLKHMKWPKHKNT